MGPISKGKAKRVLEDPHRTAQQKKMALPFTDVQQGEGHEKSLSF